MNEAINKAIEIIRVVTRGSDYEGRLYLVGGVLRDRALGLPLPDDVDMVLEGDALSLASFLHERGVTEHHPVEYERFGTAKVAVAGHDIEFVSARAESYAPDSRKPHVRQSTLHDDALRRDFTINTLMENLHTGEELDLTGQAIRDLAAKTIRTPLDPHITFHDDPLRMLRAIRFAVRLGFEIEPATWRGIREEAHRLNQIGPEPPVVSAERVRDEFSKILMGSDPARGLEMLRDSGLLAQVFPELLSMVGVTQNAWHRYDVWEHTLVALRHLTPDSSLELRLGLLLHDVGKPATRSEDARGVHFYEHQFVGAEMAETALRRLKFTNDQIRDVRALVELHMRLGEARPDWSDAAVKRLMRATHPYTETLYDLVRCDIAAMDPAAPKPDLQLLHDRMEELNRLSDVARIESPLSGLEIMETLGIPPGPLVGQAKEFLTNEVIDGRIAERDTEAARDRLSAWFSAESSDKALNS